MIVGGTGTRSVVLSATYEARAFGVRSAMPMMRARRMCPQAVIIPPDPAAYSEATAGIMEIFRSVTPLVEGDLARRGLPRTSAAPPGGWAGRPDRRAVARPDRRRAGHHGLGRSRASTKFVAKLASAAAKPNGLLVVPSDRVVEFLHPLPVGALWGVGEKTEEVLTRLGLRTVGDIAHTPQTTLVRALGPAAGQHLFALSWAATSDRSCLRSRTRASATRRPSPPTSTIRRSSIESCCGLAERTACPVAVR